MGETTLRLLEITWRDPVAIWSWYEAQLRFLGVDVPPDLKVLDLIKLVIETFQTRNATPDDLQSSFDMVKEDYDRLLRMHGPLSEYDRAEPGERLFIDPLKFAMEYFLDENGRIDRSKTPDIMKLEYNLYQGEYSWHALDYDYSHVFGQLVSLTGVTYVESGSKSWNGAQVLLIGWDKEAVMRAECEFTSIMDPEVYEDAEENGDPLAMRQTKLKAVLDDHKSYMRYKVKNKKQIEGTYILVHKYEDQPDEFEEEHVWFEKYFTMTVRRTEHQDIFEGVMASKSFFGVMIMAPTPECVNAYRNYLEADEASFDTEDLSPDEMNVLTQDALTKLRSVLKSHRREVAKLPAGERESARKRIAVQWRGCDDQGEDTIRDDDNEHTGAMEFHSDRLVSFSGELALRNEIGEVKKARIEAYKISDKTAHATKVHWGCLADPVYMGGAGWHPDPVPSHKFRTDTPDVGGRHEEDSDDGDESGSDAIRAANARLNPSTSPQTCLFLGATSGIGLATLSALLATDIPTKVYVVGRSPALHGPRLQALREASPHAELILLDAEIARLADARRVCTEILARETRLDALFLAAGYMPLAGPTPGPEGLEQSLVVNYYTRLLFVTLLLPLLRAAPSLRIVNVLAAGLETADAPLDGLRFEEGDTGVAAVMRVVKEAATYTSLALGRIARQEPGLVVVHAHPGNVSTEAAQAALTGTGLGGLAMRWVVRPFMRFVSFSPEESGDRCLHLLVSARYGGQGVPLGDGETEGTTVKGRTGPGGLFLVDASMNCLTQEKVFAGLLARGAEDKTWEHTMGVLGPYLG
ncbi:hypothetical protein ACHAQA_007235 [Verticillium albo-atrum]